jgi:hypothetical protein
MTFDVDPTGLPSLSFVTKEVAPLPVRLSGQPKRHPSHLFKLNHT